MYNTINLQKRLVTFFLEPPLELTNCTILYQTDTALGIACNYTEENETKFQFLMVIRSGSDFINVSSDVPLFEVKGLKPDSDYEIALFAVNDAGKSKPVWMEIRTYPPPDRKNRKGNLFNYNTFYFPFHIITNFVIFKFFISQINK